MYLDIDLLNKEKDLIAEENIKMKNTIQSLNEKIKQLTKEVINYYYL